MFLYLTYLRIDITTFYLLPLLSALIKTEAVRGNEIEALINLRFRLTFGRKQSIFSH